MVEIRTEELFLEYFFSLVPKEDAQILRHPLILELQRYDKRYGSRLYDTLFAYLSCERGITQTAKKMGLHRSTLIHRIERIEDMAQGTLEQPETRLHIFLTYYLDQPQRRS